MTDLEIQQIMNSTEFDLMAIAQSPNYLIAKFAKLSERGKEEVLDCLNRQLFYASRDRNKTTETPKKEVKSNVITLDFANRKPKRKGASVWRLKQ